MRNLLKSGLVTLILASTIALPGCIPATKPMSSAAGNLGRGKVALEQEVNPQKVLKRRLKALDGPGVDVEYYINEVGKGSNETGGDPNGNDDWGDVTFYYRIKDVREMSDKQANHVLGLLDLLGEKKVQKDLSYQIREDELDTSSEHGGLVTKDKDTPFTKIRSCLERGGNLDEEGYGWSAEAEAGWTSDSYFVLPYKALKIPHRAEYHIHPFEEGKWPGPSGEVIGSKWGIDYDGDIGGTLIRIKDRGQYHDLVITRLNDEVFNAHYTGGEMDNEGHIKLFILDFGNYPYSLEKPVVEEKEQVQKPFIDFSHL